MMLLRSEIQKANNALAERGSMRFAPMQADVEVNVFKPYSYAGIPDCPVKSLSKPVKTFKDNACKKFVEDLPDETEKQREAKARSRAFVDEMKKRKGAPSGGKYTVLRYQNLPEEFRASRPVSSDSDSADRQLSSDRQVTTASLSRSSDATESWTRSEQPPSSPHNTWYSSTWHSEFRH